MANDERLLQKVRHLLQKTKQPSIPSGDNIDTGEGKKTIQAFQNTPSKSLKKQRP